LLRELFLAIAVLSIFTVVTVAISSAQQSQPPGETIGKIPVPFYTSNVKSVDRQSAGSVLIKTTDSKDTVVAWYKLHLKDQAADHDTSNGHHIFTTHSGPTVDISAADARFGDGTIRIGLVWNAAKYGEYPK
jgi:hypothetical protein